MHQWRHHSIASIYFLDFGNIAVKRHAAHIILVYRYNKFCKVFGIWYLKYQILSKPIGFRPWTPWDFRLPRLSAPPQIKLLAPPLNILLTYLVVTWVPLFVSLVFQILRIGLKTDPVVWCTEYFDRPTLNCLDVAHQCDRQTDRIFMTAIARASLV